MPETMAADAQGEAQTCPRRTGEAGPWSREAGQDRWRRDRWSKDEDAVRAKHDAEDAEGLARHNAHALAAGRPPATLEEYRTKWFVRGPSADLWLWPGDVPRTCSFCGSLHPEDVLRLLAEGWEHERAKSYKGYMHRPGWATKSAAFLASLRDLGREPGQGVPSVWEPTPPAKFYVMHFTAEQLQRLNELLRNSPPAPPDGGCACG
jgi:hypothetical protein